MKEYVPVAKDCEHCLKKKGSFGCCSTVSNNWVYACAEGHKEWLLDKIRAEIVKKHLSVIEKNDFESGRTYGYEEVLEIIGKYKAESEDDEEYGFQVGDEIRHNNRIRVILSFSNDGWATALSNSGVSSVNLKFWEKTGRHFSQVAEMLSRMQEEE